MLDLDIPTQAQIDRLSQVRAPAAVTIYLAATPLTQDADQTRISLKNHLREAVTQMEAGGVDKRDIWPIEEAIGELDEDQDFWAHQAHGLAIFATPEKMRVFRLANRLTDSVHVSDRFHLKPLLRATSFANTAWVLALAEGGVRLIDVPAEGGAEEVRVPGLPSDAYDALGGKTLNDQTPGGNTSGERGKKLRLRQYARIVDEHVAKLIGDSDRPLILAAADPLRQIFAQETDIAALAEDTIQGNPEEKTPAERAEAARPIIEAHQKAKIEGLHGLFAERAEAGRASRDTASIARAAVAGAVDTLLIDMDRVLPGVLHEDGSFEKAAEDDAEAYGITDQIAQKVRASGGRVVAVRAADLPEGKGDAPMAAILRWAM